MHPPAHAGIPASEPQGIPVTVAKPDLAAGPVTVAPMLVTVALPLAETLFCWPVITPPMMVTRALPPASIATGAVMFMFINVSWQLPPARIAGTSPALARRLREELEDYLTDDMPALADLLAEVRVEVRKRGLRVENETWQRAIDGPLRVLLAQRRYDEARERLVQSLGVAEALNGGSATAPVKGSA